MGTRPEVLNFLWSASGIRAFFGESGETNAHAKISHITTSRRRYNIETTTSLDVKETDIFCPLLETPAEVRNYIYHYLIESDSESEYAPLVRYLDSPKPAERYRTLPKERAWEYFAFTQTCKQIRAEYRPLWFRNAQIRLQPQDVFDWYMVFYANPQHRRHVPKCLQISWRHDEEGGGEPLVRYHAALSPTCIRPIASDSGNVPRAVGVV
ncbi:hypothetical protein BKA66DRAFT_565725 [Pyrenochaeta sp. MPI-SDFR-AT-0127]|nr:hypothetical protein BKA66DRAFT_565725 [Pyrenochaeta sp. MPI-SDFR-AT-0127]